ncbi:iron complex outermembrane receptor protein [Sphingomonas sp. SORGH_AS 950]|uniref:TonB-dependent receptor n=1 Tax=Sphingomonas sp. SORGH_AS_0950 TaxID=3041792 RepID=UPI00278025D3|nr:TonB-dependent receptor [Sphingomonas sp. SORGH_AS_0950]MDQ1157216.1 iron complex outermembrane receptor protein [Sphingomonas sp. SORGH_AS_0950]
MLSIRGLANGVAVTAIIAAYPVTSAAAEQSEDTTEKAQKLLTGDKRIKERPRKRSKREEKLAKEAAKSGESQPQLSNDNGRLEGDIIVMGLRENVKSARNAKRRASQIVDVVVAQDIGKLPDKNIPEALARIPGIQIERNRGEGGDVKIRGLGGVMTTVNGSPTFSAGDRTTYLNDISSDMVAGIEVYKTRTPDQVEGSQTGVINLTLRRPTDFKEGATYAFSVRGDYADQIKKVNPYYSALIAYNADTAIGRLGFSVNGSINDVRYNESIRWNSRPHIPGDSRLTFLPSTTPRNVYMPWAVGFSGPNGWSKRADVNVSTQWRPDDHWSITLEGGYRKQRMLWADNQFDIPLTYSTTSAPLPVLSNIVLGPDGRLVKSLSATSLDPMGPGRQSALHKSTNYNGRFQVDFKNERFEFNSWVNWARAENDSNHIFHWIRFNQQPDYDVIFNDTTDPLGGSNVTFKNINLLDPKNYLYIDGFDQAKQFTYSSEIEAKWDLKLYTDSSFIDYVKSGFRYANRTYSRGYGFRGAYGNLRIPIVSLPNYKLVSSSKGFQGSKSASNAEWLIGDSDSIRNSFDDIRARLVGIYPELADRYPKYNPLDGFGGSDGSYAAYVMAHYNIKLLFPIDGVVGTRFVNSLTNLTAIQRTSQFVNVDNQLVEQTVDTTISPKANFLDVMPSVNAIIHFTPKLQLRTAWTYEVGRPSVYQINPRLTLDLRNRSGPTAGGGNPRLGPITTNKYDASLEWYFGPTGLASLAIWQWNQDGLIGNRQLPEILPESPNVPVLVTRPYNLGRGRHRGIEGNLTTFFSFLPGILKNFGAQVNGTMNLTRQAYPVFKPNSTSIGEAEFIYGPYLNVSKYMYNLVGFFEKDGLNVRVAYNWQSRRQWSVDANDPYNNIFLDPVKRLDASINYDVNKNLTLALEGSNLTADGNRSYFGSYAAPQDVRYFSRNFSFSVRSRF